MSGPSAEGPRPAGAGAIVGIAVGLMLCAALATWLYLSRGGAIDGAAQLEAAFGVRSLGTRYTITEARELPSGARLVILDDPNAPSEPTNEAETGAKAGTEPRVEWAKVPVPASEAWPRRVVFTFPKSSSGQAAVDAFFREGQWKDLADLGEEGGQVLVKSDKLAWRTFDARWLHERAYVRPATFRDAVRIDLSQPERPCVMTALWSRGEAASQASLQALLAQLGSG